MNEKERRNRDMLFEVHFKLQRANVSNDFRKIMNEVSPDEDLLSEKHDKFFARYAGRNVLVFQEGNDWFILEDDNYVIPESALKFHK